MNDTPAEVAALLGPEGPLARHIEAFAPRSQQQGMAQVVASALAEAETLVVEAGTGTGKTYAYLVPALCFGGKVVVSTGTRNLQDQLFHRDLPVVRRALGSPVRVAMLKGRSNYLCRYRLKAALDEPRRGGDARAETLEHIRDWAGRTRDGDIAEVTGIAENDAIWPRVTSTADNCLGQECPDYDECHVVQARRAAQEADVVVINHHLLLADMALRDDGFGELLPSADAFIVDEAHQLPDTASLFFGVSLSARQLYELARDSIVEHGKEAGDVPALPERARMLETAVATLREALGAGVRRAPWQEVERSAAVTAACEGLSGALAALTETLATAAERGRGLDNCWQRAGAFQQRLARFVDTEGADDVHWFETSARGFTLHTTPLEVADTFRSHMARYPCAWVFTSATLAVGERFEHFNDRLGLDSPRAERFDSPFDYRRNALLYRPPGLPEPNDPRYTQAVVDAALPVLEASGGRAFMLFTSYRALHEARRALDGRLAFPLLVQGEAPRDELLARFRELGNAVLLGTSSFWEGVDVRGAALSCVVIDRAPFASPGDPLLQARIDALRARGANPFMDYQLPHAVITLKQGVGRLIRDVDDRGVMVLCDPRLDTRPYGKIFFASLPPMPRTADLSAVQRFFRDAAPAWEAAAERAAGSSG